MTAAWATVTFVVTSALWLAMAAEARFEAAPVQLGSRHSDRAVAHPAEKTVATATPIAPTVQLGAGTRPLAFTSR